MSAHTFPLIRCDALNGDAPCSATYLGRDTETVNEVRATAEQDGWTSEVIFDGLGREDRCPFHSGTDR